MTAYLIEMYDRLHFIFMCGWLVWIMSTVVGAMYCSIELDKHPHKGSIRYYFILTVLSLFTIGVLGTVFLPSPSLINQLLK